MSQRLRVPQLVLLVALLLISGCASTPPTTNQTSPAATTAAVQANTGAPQPSPAASNAPAVPQPSPAASAAQANAPAAVTAPYPLAPGWWDAAVCYRVAVRSFYDSNGDGIGDLAGLLTKLDYLNDGDPATNHDLGVNCVNLTPLMAATDADGLAVTDFYTVNKDYGTNDELKQLVSELHRRGVKLVLDLPLNSTAREHPWFAEAGKAGSEHHDWYRWSQEQPAEQSPLGGAAWHAAPDGGFYYGAAGADLPDLNYQNPAVTAEMERASTFWLKEIGADGLRLLGIRYLIEDDASQADTPETHAWLRNYRTNMTQAAPDALVIGDVDGGDGASLPAYYPDQSDLYMDHGLGQQVIDTVAQGQGQSYLNAAQAAYNQLPFQRWATVLPGPADARPLAALGGDSAKGGVAAAALLSLPGLPFIGYGDEIGLSGAGPMQWATGPGGGFTNGTPWRALGPDMPEINVANQTDDASSLLSRYRQLIRLHTDHPGLNQGDLTPLVSSSPGVAAFLRRANDEVLLIILNFEANPIPGLVLVAPPGALGPGSYNATSLLDAQNAAPMPVGPDGSVAGYAPLAQLAPHGVYVFSMKR